MQALTLHAPQDIRFESVPDPKIISATDAIISVGLSAICGSDLHLYFAREELPDPGTVMGHEFMGQVLEVGSGVRTFKPGDRVVSPFTSNCGHCYFCQSGLTCRCTSGHLFGFVKDGHCLQGAQAQYVRVPLADSTLFPIPEDIDDERGLFLGDILATGYFCAQMAGIQPHGTYALIGCGPVGLLAIAAARSLGAQRIFAIDLVPERLEKARAWGAEPLALSTQNPQQVIESATQGRGADAVLEAVGNASAAALAYRLVRPGGTIAVVGVHNEPHFAFSPNDAYDKNLTYRTGRCPARALMPKMLSLLRDPRFDVATIVSHRMPLSQGAQGYRMFADKLNGCTKVILRPD